MASDRIPDRFSERLRSWCVRQAVRGRARGKAHAPQQLLEAWVVAQSVEPRIYIQVDEPVGALFARLLQVRNRALVVPQARVDSAQEVGRDVLFLRQPRQIVKNMDCVLCLPSRAQSLCQCRTRHGTATRQLYRLFARADSGFVVTRFSIQQPKDPIRDWVVRVEFHSSPELPDGLFVSARVVEMPSSRDANNERQRIELEAILHPGDRLCL